MHCYIIVNRVFTWRFTWYYTISYIPLHAYSYYVLYYIPLHLRFSVEFCVTRSNVIILVVLHAITWCFAYIYMVIHVPCEAARTQGPASGGGLGPSRTSRRAADAQVSAGRRAGNLDGWLACRTRHLRASCLSGVYGWLILQIPTLGQARVPRIDYWPLYDWLKAWNLITSPCCKHAKVS
jgi:hypothetical protein